MLSRKFRKFLKQGKFNPTCFNCNKTGHIKKDYPLLNTKGLQVQKVQQKEERLSGNLGE